MNKLLTVVISAFAIGGCGTTQHLDTSVNENKVKVERVDELYWTAVKVPNSIETKLTAMSQQLDSDRINSRVAAIKFINNGNPIKIELGGIINKLEVFSPNLALYDQNFSLIRTFSSESFDYDRNDFTAGAVLTGAVTVTVPLSVTQIHALIFTTQDDLNNTTTIIHPAKAIAIAKRTVPPEIPDPVAKHSPFGTIKISITELEGVVEKPSKVKSPSAPEIPTQNKAQVTVNKVPVSETVTYYKTSITNAVNNNDIPKALALLEEAKALNIKGAQETFVEAVNRK